MSTQAQLNAWYAAVAKGQGPPPMPPQPQGLPASQVESFAAQRRNFGLTRDQTLAQNALARSQSLANQQSDFAQLAQKWNQTREDLPGTYAHRGLLNSGIYGNALTQYGQQRVQATNALTNRYQGEIQGQDLAAKQAKDVYGNNMGNVAGAEQTARADLAAQIRGL